MYNKQNHIKFYFIYKSRYKKDINFNKTEDNIIRLMNENILNKININLSILEIINIIFDNLCSGYISQKNIQKIKSKVIRHTNRVLKHLDIIFQFSEFKGRKKFTEYEKYVMRIACMLHDIGKIYKDNDEFHAVYSYFISKYILELSNKMDETTKNLILEIILMHGNKKEYRKEISEYTALVRDADLFDENCGFSLVHILNLMIIGCKNADEYEEFNKKYLKKLNLNKENHQISDDLKEYKTCNKYVTKIKSRISIEWNKELYDLERAKAVEKYDYEKLKYLNEINNFSDQILKYEKSLKIIIK